MGRNDDFDEDEDIEDIAQTQIANRRKFIGGIFLLLLLAYIIYVILNPVPMETPKPTPTPNKKSTPSKTSNDPNILPSTNFMLKNVTKNNLCIDDGGGGEKSQLHLWECDKNNKNQQFVYDSTSKLLRNPNKDNLCIDDGGGTKNGETKLHLWECDKNNKNQQFDVMNLTTTTAPNNSGGNPIKQTYISGSSSTMWKYTTDNNDPECVELWDYIDQDGKVLEKDIKKVTMKNDTKQWCMIKNPNIVYKSGSPANTWKYATDANDKDCLELWDYVDKDGKPIEKNIKGPTMKNDTKLWCPIKTSARNLKHKASSKCLDGDGTKLYFNNCTDGNDWQNWLLYDNVLRHKKSNKCISLSSDGKYSYNDCDKNKAEQQWYYYNGLLKHSSGKCMDANGTDIYTGICNNKNDFMIFN